MADVPRIRPDAAQQAPKGRFEAMIVYRPGRSPRSRLSRLMAAPLLPVLLAGIVACGPSAPAAPTAGPAKPTEAAAKPAESKPAEAAKPAESKPADKPAAATSPAPAAAGAQAPAKPAARPAGKQGGTIVLGWDQEPVELDPPLTTSTGTLRVTRQIFDTLLLEDYTVPGPAAPPLIPGLAESWKVSDDGLTYTFTLRKGVKFHDGTPFNAQAVQTTFDRISNEQSPVFNAKAKAAPSFITQWIKEYKAVDEGTFQVVLKERFGSFLRQLANANMAIISPAQLQKVGQDQFGAQPVGTGPFKFVERERGVKIVLERNQDYWGGAPYLERVIIQPILEASGRAAALQKGDIDLDIGPQTDALEKLKADPNIAVENANAPHFWFWFMNAAWGPLKDKRVRQALNYAIDREGMSKNLLAGTALPQNMVVPPGNPVYDPNVKGYTYDVAKAKQLMADAGAGPFSMKVIFPTSGAGYIAPVQMHQFIQNNLKEIGVTLELDVREYNNFLETARKGTSDEIQAANSNWTSTSGDPYVLEQLASFKFDAPKGNDRSHYNNPEFEKILDQARGETDEAKRNALYKQADKILYDDAPWLFVVYDQSPKAYRKDRLLTFNLAASNFFSLVNVSLK